MSQSEISKIDQPDGYRMSVRSWPTPSETGKKTPLVLLHSLFFTGEMFAPTAAILSRTHDCVAPTFRGQDGRGRGDRAPTVAQLAQDILHWFDEAEYGPVHLVGSSMGAYVAMEILRHRPNQVASLTLSCCTADAEQDPARFAKLTAFLAQGPGPQTSDTIAALMFGQATRAALNPWAAFWIEHFAQTPAAMAEVVECMFAHPAYHDVLAAYSGPALLLAGRQDKAKSPGDMARIAARLPQAHSHIFETAGHTPAVEMPDAFAACIGAFLDQTASDAQKKEGMHAQ